MKKTFYMQIAGVIILLFLWVCPIQIQAACTPDIDNDGYCPPADCDDNDLLINPGIGIETQCDDVDNNCNGQIDENLKKICYTDQDGDGCGNIKFPQYYCEGDRPEQCADESCDCDDSDPGRYAGNIEIKCDGKDQDCDDEDTCPEADCLEISDVPLETLADPAPPLIVFVIDDSGSMDWSIMTSERNGTYRYSNKTFYYVFRASDHKYGNVQEQKKDSWQEKLYRSQYLGYNKIYYNPSVTYTPWPRWNDLLPASQKAKWPELPNANPLKPRSNPFNKKYTINLNDKFSTIDKKKIKRPHYYIFSNETSKLYLVNIDISSKKIDYYRASYNKSHFINKLEIENNPPEDVLVTRTYEEELQNFANWFSFYRRRMHTTKAAIAQCIDGLDGVKIGLLTINNNNSVRSSVLPVRCKNDSGTLDDQSDKLLTLLYNIRSSGGTPLRYGLRNAGKYYSQNEKSPLGAFPYASAKDGGECQQAFTIVLTDGWWNGSSPRVGHADGDNSSKYDTACFKDNHKDTLADVAMHYYERDLSSSLANKVSSRPGDTNNNQHMVTYTVSFGQVGSIDPFGKYANCPPKTEVDDCSDYCPNWPLIKANDKTTIDDLWHAAVNGRGEFFSASNPQDLVNAMKSIGRQVASVGSASAVAVNGQKFEHGALVFQSSFNSMDWSGDLKAFGTSGNDFDYDNPKWSAREKLNEKDWTERNIITSNGGKGGKYLQYLSNATLLARIHEDEDMTKKIINYICGDDTNEEKNGGKARTRFHKLGDIVHSHPLFYKEYVFIGANDGMAHVFNASTGEEIAAYVPNLVFENLSALYSPNYTHKFYCNATPTIKEAADGTYLVGGLGKGGKGFYCLKVSSDTNYESMPLWEFPSLQLSDTSEDVQMGYSYSSPYIVNTNADKWVVIFGNGFASKRGKAALYIRDLKEGTEIKTIDTHSGSYDLCNGLGTPSLVDVDFDEKVDYVFAGDMLGNLWKFDLTSTSPSDWKVAYGEDNDPKPLFQARSAEGSEGTPQPITTKPDVMNHCVHGRDGFIVIFGTGRYLTEGDTQSINQQTIYAIWDWQNDDRGNNFYFGSFTKDRTLSNTKNLGEDYKKIGLLEQGIDSGYDSSDYMVTTNNKIHWYPDKDTDNNDISHVGWYFDLPTQQERVVDNPTIREGKVMIISFIPSTSKCGVVNRSSIYMLDACNGGRLGESVFEVDGEALEVQSKTSGEPALPPSVIILDTVVKTPAFVHTDEGQDRMVFGDMSASSGFPTIEIQSEQGRFYWKY